MDIVSKDEQFADRLEMVLRKQLGNAQFTSEDFCKEMNMSRSQLHRKLKKSTGLSASAFIRNYRVKAAAEILQNGQWDVQKVREEVGFSHASYFTKTFKDIIGKLPSEYRQSASAKHEEHQGFFAT
jgi:AraC-like DNA-binding protein